MTLATTEQPRLMTVEELLALPDDGVERDLIFGKLMERPMTRRNRRHSRSNAKFASVLDVWLLTQPEPRGEVLSGEAGFILAHNPDLTVGIDVAYISAETARANPDSAWLVDGIPVLAVEILSPSDTQENISDKIAMYLKVGVPLVWVADPVFKTVIVYQPGAEPVLFNASQYLDGGPRLPGFRVLVADLFE
jgi:Uma2 family endonuclease